MQKSSRATMEKLTHGSKENTAAWTRRLAQELRARVGTVVSMSGQRGCSQPTDPGRGFSLFGEGSRHLSLNTDELRGAYRHACP